MKIEWEQQASEGNVWLQAIDRDNPKPYDLNKLTSCLVRTYHDVKSIRLKDGSEWDVLNGVIMLLGEPEAEMGWIEPRKKLNMMAPLIMINKIISLDEEEHNILQVPMSATEIELRASMLEKAKQAKADGGERVVIVRTGLTEKDLGY